MYERAKVGIILSTGAESFVPPEQGLVSRMHDIEADPGERQAPDWVIARLCFHQCQ